MLSLSGYPCAQHSFDARPTAIILLQQYYYDILLCNYSLHTKKENYLPGAHQVLLSTHMNENHEQK